MPRIIGTCMLGNERDIVEAFVRHNLRLLDALVVLEHEPLDGTAAILRDLVREGLPLILLTDPERAFRQGERQTLLARRYLGELAADWCFVLDADEFIAAPGRAELEAALQRIPPGACGLVPLRHYFPLPPGAARNGEAAPLPTHRMRTERNAARKVVLPRAFAAEPHSHVSLGNHAAVRVAEGRVTPWPHALLDGVFLAHFPVRSADQVAKKVLLGWLAHRLTRPERLAGNGPQVPASHWRDLFAGLVEGRLGIDDALVNEAIAFYAGPVGGLPAPVSAADLVHDPLPPGTALRYTGAPGPSAAAVVAAWCDKLVDQVTAREAAAQAAR